MQHSMAPPGRHQTFQTRVEQVFWSQFSANLFSKDILPSKKSKRKGWTVVLKSICPRYIKVVLKWAKYTTVYLVAIKQSEQGLNKCFYQVSANHLYLENKNPEIQKLVMVVRIGNTLIKWVWYPLDGYDVHQTFRIRVEQVSWRQPAPAIDQKTQNRQRVSK